MQSFYDLSARTARGENFDFSSLRGRKVLIVNTASECGYTPQLAALQELSETFKDRFVVLAFPCNQFGGQEPGSDQEIVASCSANYGVSFTIFSKCDVKGPNVHPVWRWLTEKELNGALDSTVKWNFQKYAISESGQLDAVYPHAMDPLDEQLIGWVEQKTLFST